MTDWTLDSSVEVTNTMDYSPPCEHANGWNVSVPFWVYRKRVFVCSDCGEAMACYKPTTTKG